MLWEYLKGDVAVFNNQQPHYQGQPAPNKPPNNNYYQSIQGLAITCAIICTFLFGPLLGEWSAPFISDLITDIYGAQWIEGGLFIWKALCIALVFFLTRAFVVAAIVSFGIGIATRFPLLLA